MDQRAGVEARGRFPYSASMRSLLLLALGACAVSPVDWEDARRVQAPDSAAILVIEGDGAAALVPAPEQPSWVPEGACAASMRFAEGSAERYAVWWAPRDDGSAELRGARSDDGGVTWTAAVPVETEDRWSVGCDRPAPAVAVDHRTGYIHVAYFAHGPHGPGVFFSHSMERATYFHDAVQIVYGPRPAQVAVAADGPVVAVAYQDPNSRAPRISVRISRTEGHLFETPVTGVSAANLSAHDPRVSVKGSTVAVGWRVGDPRGVPMVRVGLARP